MKTRPPHWIAAATLLLVTLAAQAQGAWPDKPITMIVPFPPGGVADTVARPVAESLARELKQQVLVENKAGAGGATGIGAAARASADGYTVLLSLSSISILPEADKLLARRPQFTIDQFKPIARFTADPTVLVVRAEAPWKTLAEFVADLKSQPGRYNYGSSGNYGTMHVPMEMLKARAGFRMTHIPYTGAGPAVLALLGGQVDALATGPSTVAQHIRAGKLRALALTTARRSSAMPEVPTIAESARDLGLADFDVDTWFGLFAPAKLPPDVTQRLHRAFVDAMAAPEVKARASALMAELSPTTPEQFTAFVRSELAKYEGVVKASGARID
jgi:tripartite-type tricarboxylate transporter receptor subunit TctC